MTLWSPSIEKLHHSTIPFISRIQPVQLATPLTGCALVEIEPMTSDMTDEHASHRCGSLNRDSCHFTCVDAFTRPFTPDKFEFPRRTTGKKKEKEKMMTRWRDERLHHES
ncbi:unnamed protein product [Hymenolepis diminuta]|uniref:Uncharacterized protein n=1 Tax=Hymenolepis diminuta TaxID=6216 RepID=A0A564YS41_HYMDI|nr:unnamed protein product [Hymenolepis diminuta]VUZ45668.1 unnamed protein product [Hymenolepis diminuta]VUZ50092.1 unnamed protein product [Hymenolepis diminuta]VUZ50095.1 unnamed protein product [Hymenolepis diminuta]